MALIPRPTPESFINDSNSADAERASPRLGQTFVAVFTGASIGAIQVLLEAFFAAVTNRWAIFVSMNTTASFVSVEAGTVYNVVMLYTYDKTGISN